MQVEPINIEKVTQTAEKLANKSGIAHCIFLSTTGDYVVVPRDKHPGRPLLTLCPEVQKPTHQLVRPSTGEVLKEGPLEDVRTEYIGYRQDAEAFLSDPVQRTLYLRDLVIRPLQGRRAA